MTFSVWHLIVIAIAFFSLFGAYQAAAARKPWLYAACVLFWPFGCVYGIYRCFRPLPAPAR